MPGRSVAFHVGILPIRRSIASRFLSKFLVNLFYVRVSWLRSRISIFCGPEYRPLLGSWAPPAPSDTRSPWFEMWYEVDFFIGALAAMFGVIVPSPIFLLTMFPSSCYPTPPREPSVRFGISRFDPIIWKTLINLSWSCFMFNWSNLPSWSCSMCWSKRMRTIWRGLDECLGT